MASQRHFKPRHEKVCSSDWLNDWSKRRSDSATDFRTIGPMIGCSASTKISGRRLIESTIGRREQNKHPATRCFQAIRIKINNELADLALGLEAAIKGLRPGGKLVVISFHSLEDRLVKRSMREAARPGGVRRNIPAHPDWKPSLRLLGNAVKPSQAELSVNPRARSAVMRVAEKIV